MLLTVYDPDIAVLAERRLHDGNANAINGGITNGDNEAIRSLWPRSWGSGC